MELEDAKKRAEQFFHHDKPESGTPPVDPEFGKKPAKDPIAKRAEHKARRAAEAAAKGPHTERDVERSVKESLTQADQYGREMKIPQTLPQTLTEEQNPFGGSMNEKGNVGIEHRLGIEQRE